MHTVVWEFHIAEWKDIIGIDFNSFGSEEVLEDFIEVEGVKIVNKEIIRYS